MEVSNKKSSKSWNIGTKQSIWIYAWKVDYRSYLFIKEIDGEI